MKRKLTDEQIRARDERRAKFRALWKKVAHMPELDRIALANQYGLRTVEGKELSLCNTLLCAMQNPRASVVGGFRQWIKQGRAVKNGEHGMMIWVPTGVKKEGEPVPAATDSPQPSETAEPTDTRFIVGTVFDIGQTQEIESGRVNTLEMEAA